MYRGNERSTFLNSVLKKAAIAVLFYVLGYFAGQSSPRFAGVRPLADTRYSVHQQEVTPLPVHHDGLLHDHLLHVQQQRQQQLESRAQDKAKHDEEESGSEDEGSQKDESSTSLITVVDSSGEVVRIPHHGIAKGLTLPITDPTLQTLQDKHLAGEQLSAVEIESLPMYSNIFSKKKLASGRKLFNCPPWDDTHDNLQIPLKHLPRKIATAVHQKYDRRAINCQKDGIWHKISLDDHRKILEVIINLLQVKRGQNVFDWGSGCGHKLQFLQKKYNINGFGIDVSEKSVQYALVNTTKANHFCKANGVRMNDWMPENYFDHALSFGSVYHVYNRTLFCSVLRSMVRIVRPGGRVYNGWTENAEYRRQDVVPCMRGLDVDIKVIEEAKEFRNVAVFPLKAHQTRPNTYSVLIEKRSPTKASDWEDVPLTCDKHKCEPK